MAQWLRCCATNRKVAGSIPAGVIGIFHWPYPSGLSMALGSTQPLTEMCTRSISWGLRRPMRKADNLPPSCAVVMKSGNLNFLEPSGHLGPVMGMIYLFIQKYYYFLQLSCHSMAVVLTLVQTKQIWINIHKRNSTKTQYKQYKT